MLDKQPDGKEIIKITIKNPTLGGQPQVQENTHVKFVKPKSPEVGKWKTNEAKVQRKRIKPTFDMLLSKYANQAAGSSSNRSSHLKRSRSPPKQEFQRYHARPYGSLGTRTMDGATPLCAILHGRLQWRMGAAPNGPLCFSSGWADYLGRPE